MLPGNSQTDPFEQATLDSVFLVEVYREVLLLVT